MKKFLFLGALAAMLLGTASCSDDMEPQLSDGTVSFKVELPGNFESRAIADGTTATKLEVACYDANGVKLPVEPTAKTDFVNREATVTYKLVKGQTYNFAFFAHADGAPYTFTPGENIDGCKFDVNYTGACNDEKRDAFYAVLKDYSVTTAETEVKLHRPFAQLNFGADDLAAAKAAGITPSQSMVKVSKAASTFSLFSGETSNDVENIEYTLANLPDATTVDGVTTPAILRVEEKNYDWMEMCYFLVPGNEANVDVEMTLKTNGSDVKVPVANVPVKKNHRTNIVGSLFTQDANFRIIIDQNFDNYDYDIVNGKLMLKNGMTAEEINKIIENGFASFALAEDVDIDNSIVIPAGKTVTLDLNGHKLYNTQDIWNETTYKYELISVEGGNLTINGNGDVIAKANDCYPVSVWGGGNLVINGGNYNGNLHSIYVAKGTATINGGTFDLQQLETSGNGYRQEINCLDANYTNGTAQIIVTGGKFHGFDPENSMSEPIAPVSLLAPGYESVQDGDWYKVQPITPVEVSTNEELDAALKATGKKNIAVKLMNDVQLSYGARVSYGDANTKSIIIDGNGHTLNLYGEDSNWSSFGAWNGDLIIKNATINKTENGQGTHQHNYSIMLKNVNGNGSNELTNGKVYLQNVHFNRAVWIYNDAEFENVSITDNNLNHYALWVNANVKNVSLKNCSIVATNSGRGIKVVDEDVAEATRVQCNINISNCSFETKKKAAILVTNTAGAKITASNIDISKVTADSEHAVWNDEDRAAAWDLVEVYGCTKKQEGQ